MPQYEAGSLLGPYRIDGVLGAGGMGIVYLAWDTRLDRPVALKTSNTPFDERFEREARTIASITHPNVCTLYDVGPDYLVMELVEGRTLSERLARGRIPYHEALAVADQLAAALEAAHAKGIVHRDLKPANVKITPDGHLKVLDFGLAKAVSTAAMDASTVAAGLTQVGTIVGTAAYMAPEQALGEPVDKRADIWAFGALLYEMLTGRKAFEAASSQATLAAVLTEEPDWEAVPTTLHRLLRRCMAKSPSDRLRDIGDARLELRELMGTAAGRLPSARVDAEVHEAPDARAPVTAAGRDRAGAARRPSEQPLRTALVFFAVAGLAAIAVAVWAPWRAAPGVEDALEHSVAGASPSGALESVPESAMPRASIAVLPFVNMSADPEQEYFSDGLSEAILNQLAQTRGLRVPGWTSSLAFKGRALDLRSVGETLSVDYVLEGSMQRVGNALRITARLVATADGFNLLSRTYARELDDVFAVQDEISAAVADALRAELGIDAESSLASDGADHPAPFVGTQSVASYDHYLRGRQLRDRLPQEAIAELQRAIDIDPEFAMAWVWLSYSHGRALGAARSDEAERQALEPMQRAALRAVELVPDHWDTQAALGWVHVVNKDWVEADRAFARVLRLAEESGIGTVPETYPGYLSQIGRVEEALAGHLLVQAGDPLNPVHSFNVQLCNILLGRPEEAIAEYTRNAALPGAFDLVHGSYNFAWLIAQDDADAVTRAFATSPSELIRRLAGVWSAREATLAVLREALDEPGYHSRNDFQILALVAGYYEDTTLAVELLRDAYLGGGYAGFFAMWHPTLSSTRRTEGFKRFARELGFVELWRQTGNWGDYCRPLGDDDFECT